MSQEESKNLKEKLRFKTAEAIVSNAKVGEYIGKLMDTETRMLILSEDNKVMKERLEEYDNTKADLQEKNKRVHAQETNVVALKDKVSDIKKQHQAELEHHGKIIDDLQMQVAEKEKMIETMSDEIKKIKKVTKLKGVKK